MKVKFYLKDVSEEKAKEKDLKEIETAIFAQLTNAFYKVSPDGEKIYSKLKIFIKKTIKPKYWNFKEGRAIETSKFPEYPEFNQYLTHIKSEINKLHSDLLRDKIFITPEIFKHEFENRCNPKPEPDKVEFYQFATQFIGDAKTVRKETSLKSYRNSLGHIKNFADKYNIKLTFDSITLDFRNKFVDYLKTDMKFAPNTIWRIFRDLKMFLNQATERELTTNLTHKKRGFAVKTETTDVIYLNNSELSKIFSVDLSKYKKLDRVRDLFLIGCYTGLRYSDFSKLTPENIFEHEGTKMIGLRAQKTKETVYIPLHPVIDEILIKYNGKLPRAASNQKFNEYLKEVARKSELNELINNEETKGHLKTSTMVKKSELVSTHTARRSFATNAYLAGMDTIAIRKITGHKTEKAFLTYIRLTGKENAKAMANHEFFKTPLLKIAK